MTGQAWHVGCTKDQVGEAAILVRNRSAIELLAHRLEAATVLPELGGFTTVIGSWRGWRMTATAVGVGASSPIMALRELAALGVDVFVRVDNVMAIGVAGLGDVLVADSALAPDGSMSAFTPPGHSTKAHQALVLALASAPPTGRTLRQGRFASFDSYYGTMYPLLPNERPEIATERERLAELGVLALDLETAPLLAMGSRLGLATASLCLGAVDPATEERLSDHEMTDGEADLCRTALDGVVRFLEARG
ncbi:MAG: hypothetical protein AAF414_17245 [Pseudomonadota bacterium]